MSAPVRAIRGGMSVTDEQAEIVAHVLARPVTVVSAGAGTGKTWTTLATVLELLELPGEERASIEQFALITFTKTAADHLRAELDGALRGKIASSRDAEERLRWTLQQEKSTSAFVGTIHGFCAHLLRTYGYEERVAREMAVGSSKMLLDEATEAAVEALLGGPARLLDLDLRGHELRHLAQEVLDHVRTRGVEPGDVVAHTREQADDEGKPLRVEMAELVAEVERRYAELKAARQGLDQTDLLLRARALLTGGQGAAIARRLGERHPFVFVDEFQDTDRIQKGILDALLPFLERLLVVGDRKQAIYGWRAADVSIMEDLAGEHGTTALPLRTSRRPREPLLAVQNALFRVMSERYREFDEPLAPPEGAEPRAAFRLPPFRYVSAGRRASPDDRLRTTARQIEAVLAGDRVTGAGEAARRVRPGEVAVLLRSVRNVVRYAGEFQRLLEGRGIPVRAEVGGGLYRQPEIVSTCHVLRLLLHHPDDTALSVALRTPYLRRADLAVEEQRILQMGPTEETPLTDWFEDQYPEYATQLAQLRRATRTDTVPQLLARLYTAFDVRGYYRATGQPRAAQNLEKLREVARTMFRREQALTLRQFVRSLELSILTGAEEAEGDPDTPPEESGNEPPYVRVMTVHRSKGLQFPVVVLPEVQAPLGGEDRTPGFVVDGAGLDLDLTAGDTRLRSPRYPAAVARVRQAQLAEEMRILYVAVTRARESVVLVGSGEQRPPNGPDDPFYSWRDELLAAWRRLRDAGAEFVRDEEPGRA